MARARPDGLQGLREARLATAIDGRTVENEDLVNLPNWLPLRFRLADGAWFDMRSSNAIEHRLELDLWREPSDRAISECLLAARGRLGVTGPRGRSGNAC